MGVLVKYTDIALGAKEAFDITAPAKLSASNVALIKTENAEFKRYDVPLDLNSFILDGEAQFLPEDELAQIGFISEAKTNENADFDEPIVFEFEASNAFTSPGLSIMFDELKNIYSTHLNIKWYHGDTFLVDKDFYPTSPNYFCNNKVEFYNKIVISFYSLNVPETRLRVNHLEHGLKTQFKGDELKSAKIIQELSPISTNIPINPFDFTIDSKKDIEFSFQTKQPIEVVFNDNTRATTFVKNAKRKSKTIWQIQSEDYIGLLDSIYFKGGIYTNKNAVELIGEIFTVAKVPFYIQSGFENVSVTGYIPYTTCREALMQVVFAMGAVADTSNSDRVNIFALSEDVSQNITKRRISTGQNFDNETRVTAVELVSHAYSEIEDTLEAYNAEKNGTGNNILVTFSEPLHELSIISGEIIESGVNYAVINANTGCKLVGKKYEHTTVIHRKENPLVLTTDIENVIAIENATLVSVENVDFLLEKCYNYLVNTEKVNMKIIEGKNNQQTTVGDLISYETEYLGERIGRIVRQQFSLVGGILIKDSVVR